MADTRENFVRFSLRLPKTIMERLEAATGGKRSANAEIIARLEQTFAEDDYLASLEADSPHDPPELINPAEDPEYTPFELTTRERLIADEVVRRLELRDAEKAKRRATRRVKPD